jgi:Uma2 family endonuclease
MAHVREQRIGTVLASPIDVIFDRKRALILQPDLLFVSRERRAILGDQVNGAPDMVLEVLSPHPRIGELNERLSWFAEYGVREIWLLHQVDERLIILTTDGSRIAAQQTFDYLTPITSGVLPHFSLTVADVLRE